MKNVICNESKICGKLIKRFNLNLITFSNSHFLRIVFFKCLTTYEMETIQHSTVNVERYMYLLLNTLRYLE